MSNLGTGHHSLGLPTWAQSLSFPLPPYQVKRLGFPLHPIWSILRWESWHLGAISREIPTSNKNKESIDWGNSPTFPPWIKPRGVGTRLQLDPSLCPFWCHKQKPWQNGPILVLYLWAFSSSDASCLTRLPGLRSLDWQLWSLQPSRAVR